MAQGVLGSCLRSRIILTFRHYEGGRSSIKSTCRLYPRRNPWYSLSEAESTSEYMVLSGKPRKKPRVTSPGIDPRTVRIVAQRVNTIYIYIEREREEREGHTSPDVQWRRHVTTEQPQVQQTYIHVHLHKNI